MRRFRLEDKAKDMGNVEMLYKQSSAALELKLFANLTKVRNLKGFLSRSLINKD